MFGTDYFYASPKFQLEVMMRIMDKLSLDQKDQDAILFKNAERVFFNNQV
jgi:predicted TIM-barrel fold metal-dependent hydrolase